MVHNWVVKTDRWFQAGFSVTTLSSCVLNLPIISLLLISPALISSNINTVGPAAANQTLHLYFPQLHRWRINVPLLHSVLLHSGASFVIIPGHRFLLVEICCVEVACCALAVVHLTSKHMQLAFGPYIRSWLKRSLLFPPVINQTLSD